MPIVGDTHQHVAKIAVGDYLVLRLLGRVLGACGSHKLVFLNVVIYQGTVSKFYCCHVNDMPKWTSLNYTGTLVSLCLMFFIFSKF